MGHPGAEEHRRTTRPSWWRRSWPRTRSIPGTGSSISGRHRARSASTRGPPTPGFPSRSTAHLHLMAQMGRQEEWLPEAPDRDRVRAGAGHPDPGGRRLAPGADRLRHRAVRAAGRAHLRQGGRATWTRSSSRRGPTSSARRGPRGHASNPGRSRRVPRLVPGDVQPGAARPAARVTARAPAGCRTRPRGSAPA